MDPFYTGRDNQTNRKLILYSLDAADDLPEAFGDCGRYFVAMLVWDANNASDTDITVLSRKLIDAGCVYLCCWGSDCERVHDLFDSEWEANGFESESDDTIITTWHTDDTLDEFIYFSLLHTKPTNRYQRDCSAIVALVVNGADCVARIQTVFANPCELYAEHEG